MFDDPRKTAEWFKLIFEIGILVLPQAKTLLDFNKNPKLQKDPFLIYDADFLIGCHKSERPIASGIPYSEMANLLGKSPGSIQIHVMRGDFKLQSGDKAWSSISKAGFQALRDSKRIGASEPMIHLRSARREGNKLILKVQKARYHDQAQSNLILDWPTQVEPRPLTLRDLLAAKYERNLPDLADRRLANTVGVACLLFYKEGNRLVPYLVRRVEQVGVYPGGIQCTASGAANWPNTSEKSFGHFFFQAMYRELEEEVGLKAEDIADLKAVSLCREFLRGGKPQLFFAGFTRLSRNQLRERRIQAADTVKKISGWTEVERDTWFRSSGVVIPPQELDQGIKEQGISLEGLGSYFHGKKYIEKYGHQFAK